MSAGTKNHQGAKMARLVQRELDEISGEFISNVEVKVDGKAVEHIRKNVVAELYAARPDRCVKARPRSAKPKTIILQCELLPFSSPTRKNDIQENGLPWRCDGEPVTFSLQHAHDELQVFTLNGEYVTGFPVEPDGRVMVRDLPADIYILYLHGRRIAALNFT